MNNKSAAYRVYTPTIPAGPVVVNSPHSGRDYSMVNLQDMSCSLEKLRHLEDVLMDVACDLPALGQYGITAIEALFPRSYIDPNRPPTSIDPVQIWEQKSELFTCIPDKYTAMGFGLVPIQSPADDIVLYSADNLPREKDILSRMAYHTQYHHALKQTLADVFKTHGGYAFLDMHSCSPYGAPDAQGVRMKRADIILSNCLGRSCDEEFLNVVADAYKNEGLTSIAINTPFQGGYITDTYGRHNAEPGMGYGKINALQIEINKRVYLDEGMMAVNENIANVQRANQRVYQAVDAYMQASLTREIA